MAIRELQTRIRLKYDSYEAWKDSDLVLLPGEIGICTIPTGSDQATTNPTVLFKVGDGSTPAKTLQWASALAADVYGWAKASNVVYDKTKKTITFVGGGAKNADGTASDIVFDFNYVTADEVTAMMSSTVQGVADNKSRLDALLGSGEGSDTGSLAAQLAAIEDAYELADKGITDKIGDVGTGTVAAAIEAAKGAAIADAEAKVNALADGQVKTNKADIADLLSKINTEITNRGDADDTLNERIEKIEAFFGDADREDGGYEHLSQALDTLVEIQTYLNGDGQAASDIVSRLGAAEDAIDDLETEFDAGGRVTTAEQNIADLTSEFDTNGRVAVAESEIDALQAIVAGYSGADAIKNAIKAVQDDVDDLDEILNTPDTGIVALINNNTTGLNATYQLAHAANEQAKTNKQDIADIKSEYLTKSDEYIFNCGSATKVVHEPDTPETPENA